MLISKSQSKKQKSWCLNPLARNVDVRYYIASTPFVRNYLSRKWIYLELVADRLAAYGASLLPHQAPDQVASDVAELFG